MKTDQQDAFWSHMSFVWKSSSKDRDIDIDLENLMKELDDFIQDLEDDLNDFEKDLKSGVYIYTKDFDFGIDENSIFGKWLAKMKKLLK